MSDDGLFEIQTSIDAITDKADAQIILDLINKVDWIGSRSRELKKELEPKLIAWIEANGDIEVGTVRYYIGNNKKDKCNDLPLTVQALFTACGGDFETFCSVLSANAIKAGAAKKLIGEDKFAKLFDTIIEKDIKTGKPVKMVHRVDSRFVTKPAIVAEGDS